MRALALVTAMVAAIAVAPARAASTKLVAGPGSFATSWSTPVVVASPADQPLLVNSDVAFHNVESASKGPDTQPWCGAHKAGDCPLFVADLTVPMDGVNPILGLENARPGATYAFRCTLFENMRGLLLVIG